MPLDHTTVYSCKLLTQHSYSDSDTHHHCPAYIVDKLFGNRTSEDVAVLAQRTSEKFKIFLPLRSI